MDEITDPVIGQGTTRGKCHATESSPN